MATFTKQLEETLELYLVKKAPAIPTGGREALVKFLPWIILVFFILSIPVVLALFGISAALLPFSYMMGPGYGANYTLSLVILAVSVVLEALAIPGLFNKTRRGWELLFWSTLVGFVSSLLSGSIVSAIIWTLISLYLLFQIRSYYK